jgi:phospholipid/cholesterol/gamma-HCH transport system substrate-binding protein
LKISKEFKVGFFFVLAIAALIWGLNFLKGKNLFAPEKMYYAVYHEISGLEKSNPVYLNGLKVGQVSSLYFEPSMNGDIIVELSISSDFPVASNTVAKIFSSDLMGSKAVELVLGDSQELAEYGDTLMTSLEASLSESVNAQIAPLKKKAEDLISSIDTMVVAVQGVFNKDIKEELLASIQSVRSTFQNLENTSANLDEFVITQSSRIASILYNIDMISRNLDENEDKINTILANLEVFSDSLSHANIPETFTNLNKAVADIHLIVNKINKGEGSMGMLINDDKLYIELEKAARELNMLVEDVRVNPKKYVRFSVF